MPVTIKDVSREAGVSRTTVSLVLNGQSGTRISAETAQRVRDVARRLGYQPDIAARRLRVRREGGFQTFCVGFLLNTVMEPATAPYYTEVLNGLQSEMRPHGYHLTLGSGFETSVEKLAYLQRLTHAVADGWVLADLVEDAVIAWLRDTAVPAVVVGGGTVTSDLDCVYPDDAEAGRLLTRHLLDLGHRRLAFVTYASHSASLKARLQGFRQALEEHGISPEAAAVYPVGLEPEALAAWLRETVRSEEGPTAVIAYDDRQALAVMKAAQAQGLTIPQELSVAGFDDIPLAGMWEPGLTTVRMPMREIGAMAFRRLLERIRNSQRPPMKIMLPVELMVRASTAPPARRERS